MSMKYVNKTFHVSILVPTHILLGQTMDAQNGCTFKTKMYQRLFIILDSFELKASGCIDPAFVPLITYDFYVEMALSGCKHLCESVHDMTCTIITFVPLQRSCILHPLQAIPWVKNVSGCIWAETYHRHRSVGMYNEDSKEVPLYWT